MDVTDVIKTAMLSISILLIVVGLPLYLRRSARSQSLRRSALIESVAGDRPDLNCIVTPTSVFWRDLDIPLFRTFVVKAAQFDPCVQIELCGYRAYLVFAVGEVVEEAAYVLVQCLRSSKVGVQCMNVHSMVRTQWEQRSNEIRLDDNDPIASKWRIYSADAVHIDILLNEGLRRGLLRIPKMNAVELLDGWVLVMGAGMESDSLFEDVIQATEAFVIEMDDQRGHSVMPSS